MTLDKRFAIFLFDDEKNGHERYTYLKDIELTPSPAIIEGMIKGLFVEHILDGHYSETQQNIKVSTLDMRITINDVKFQSQINAYIPKQTKSIVLAERIRKESKLKDAVPCAYCEGYGTVPASDDENEKETITCAECKGSGTFSIQELVRIDNRTDIRDEDES